ncbi:exodeoxyribonuclease VII small subunit [Brockia lithotrophica]|uniref:Exodeoxyribonuclease 7 small subunit n=1 Tax=Brockia lithotrophica TaxID=933949 RepID=A0A660L7C0_9BACL|nr:exodeoxyribonuclease VII small subunit [Brockia lithotrophica]RKQ88732.1 exodeoxyribonuclease VII small subunit [Brockia lithotrophica]
MDDLERAGKDAWTFEKALARLEEVVERLESADLPLDKALSLYEEGTRLVRYLNGELNRFEQRVRRLREEEVSPEPKVSEGFAPASENELFPFEGEEDFAEWEDEIEFEEEFPGEEEEGDDPNPRL